MERYILSFEPFSLVVIWDGVLIERIFIKKGSLEEKRHQLPDPVRKLKMEVSAYLKGNLRRFSPYNLKFSSLSPFFRRVLKVTSNIPYGTLKSYSEIAEEVGGKKYARAVGMVLSKNPFPILIPCHRVIRKNGELGGFSGGVNIKRFLIDLESKFKKN